MINKKALLTILVLTSLSLFYSNLANSSTNSNITNFAMECRGCSLNLSYAVSLPDINNFQAWQARVAGSVEGHGGFGRSGGRYGMDMCLSPNGAMWSGSCWNIVDANTGGNIGDGNANIDQTRNIGSDPTPSLGFAVVSVYVNDATYSNGSLRVDGRQVSIDGFNTTSNNVNVGGQFDITWGTSEVTGEGIRLDYNGPVSCDIGNSPVFRGGNMGDGTTCMATGVGMASFTLSATGYNGRSGQRPKTIAQGPIEVNISNIVNQAKYRCSGAGTCTRDDINGNTFSPNCNNSCIAIPNPPSISGPSTGSPGVNYTYNINGTDPAGSTVRYGIDWDVNGTVDLWLPSSGYVNSGVTQSTLRNFPSNGTYSFNALTQNSFGLNSSWAQKIVVISSLRTDGMCGSANKTYPSGSVSYGSDTLCDDGQVSSCSSGAEPNCSFPSPNSSVTWICLGSNGGTNSSCRASVAIDTFTVMVNVNNPLGGKVVSQPYGIDCGSICSNHFPKNTLVTLIPTPKSFYWKFTGWSGDCTGTGACILNIDSSKNVIATFSPRTYRYFEF